MVEADNAQDALDAFVDSNYRNMILADEPCPHNDPDLWDECDCQFAGNARERVDTSYYWDYGPCMALYFENPNNWDEITGGRLERVSK